MKIRVSKHDLLLIPMLLVMTLPVYFTEIMTGYQFIMNIATVYLLMYLVTKREKMSGFMVGVILYHAILLFTSIINHRFNIHYLVSNIKIVLMLLFLELHLKRYFRNTVRCAFLVFTVYVLCDFVSVVLYPDGLYFTENVWNEWTTGYTPQWILGNKNNRILWYCMTIICTFLIWYMHPGFLTKSLAFSSIAVTLIAVIIVKSSASTSLALMLLVGMIIAMKKNMIKNRLNYRFLLISYITLLSAVFIGSTDFLAPIVEGIFHKEMTFSSRTTIWALSLAQIIQKPLLGWGIISTTEAQEILHHLAFVNAHNQWLQTLWQGGILLLLALIGIILLIFRSLATLKYNRLNIFAVIFMMALLIEWIFEVQIGSTVSWILLLFLYHIPLAEQLEDKIS